MDSKFAIVWITSTLLFFGCEQKFLEKHYEGNLLSYSQSGYSATTVSMDLREHDDFSGTIEIKDIRLRSVSRLSYSLRSSGEFELTIPTVRQKPFVMTKKDRCYL